MRVQPARPAAECKLMRAFTGLQRIPKSLIGQIGLQQMKIPQAAQRALHRHILAAACGWTWQLPSAWYNGEIPIAADS